MDFYPIAIIVFPNVLFESCGAKLYRVPKSSRSFNIFLKIICNFTWRVSPLFSVRAPCANSFFFKNELVALVTN